MSNFRSFVGSAALATLIATAMILPARASADEFDRRGFYVGVSGVYAIDLFKDQIASLIELPGEVVTLTGSAGVNARAGYRVLSWLSVEAQYEWVQSLEVMIGPIPAADFESHAVTGNLKLYLPWWRIQPYALAGVGVSILNITPTGFPDSLVGDSGTGFAARLGVGADVYLTKNVALNVEGAGILNTTSFDLNDIAELKLDKLYYFSVSAGLVYRF